MLGMVTRVRALSHSEPFVDTTRQAPSDFVKTFRTEIPRVATPVYKNGLVTVYFEPKIKKDNVHHYYLYDIEEEETELNGNEEYRYKGEIVDPGIVYIIKNGYPAKSYSITNSAAYPDKSPEMNNYTVTQLALWIYNHEVWGKTFAKYDVIANMSTNAFYRDLVVKAKALSDAAKAVHDREWNGSRIIPAMNEPVVSSTSLKVVNSNYLLSEVVEVPTVMLDKFTVTADKGMIVDLNGNQKQTFNPGDKFRVRYNTPEDVTIRVTIKANSSYDHLYAYTNYTNHDHMDLLLAVIQNEPQSFEKVLTFSYSNENKIRVSNQNVITGSEVAGTTLVIKDQAGNIVVNPWVTTLNPIEVTLDPGTYLLYETIATTGYKLNSDPVRFTVKSDGTVDEPLIMKNEPLRGLKIEYKDGTTGKMLPGANLRITLTDGTLISNITTTDKLTYITLEPGTYKLFEVVHASGYAKSPEEFTFTVDSNGITEPIEINVYSLKGFTVSLLDKSTKKYIPGAILALQRMDGTEVAKWETTNEPYKAYVQAGTYKLVELSANEEYILSEEEIEVVVNKNGETSKDIIMYNELAKIPVPITGMTRTILVFVSSLLLIGCGFVLLYKSRKQY
jgi:TQXA domain-containing protein